MCLGPEGVFFARHLAQLFRRTRRDTDRTAKQGIKRIHPDDLRIEYAPEVARHRLRDFVERNRTPQRPLKGGDRPGRDAAGDNEIEILEIGVHVQREAVRRDAARNVHADGGDLGLRLRGRGRPRHIDLRPNSGHAGHSLGRDAEIGAGADQRFFQPPHIIHRAQRFLLPVRAEKAAQIEDRVADQLPRPVVGDVAAPACCRGARSSGPRCRAAACW